MAFACSDDASTDDPASGGAAGSAVAGNTSAGRSGATVSSGTSGQAGVSGKGGAAGADSAGGTNAGGQGGPGGAGSAGAVSTGGTDTGGQSAGGQSASGSGGSEGPGGAGSGQAGTVSGSSGQGGDAGPGGSGQPGTGAGGGDPQGGQGGTSVGTAGTGGSGPTCVVAVKTGPFAPADALDFLVQDVCLDSQGHVTADDPATCACRRDLALDEALPYHKADTPDGGNPFGFQISDSFPMRLAGGGVGALHTFDMGFGEAPGEHLRSFFEFDTAQGGFGAARPTTGFPVDGYDLVEQNGALTSIITTCDGGGGVQPMWAWKDSNPLACQLEDAWLLFDRNQVSPSLASTVAHLRINAPSQTCPHDKLNSAYTEWRQQDVTYSTGKTLSSIVASHYGGAAPETADHIERFYLTREYGKARWERWNLTAPGYEVHCDGPKQETHGNRTFYMVDCRDWTHIHADPRGGFEPRTWPVDLRAGRGNLVINGDFGAGLDYLGPWERFGEDVSRSILEINDPSRIDHRNRHLALGWNGQNSSSIHQDLDNPSLAAGTVVDFGARIWSDAPSHLDLQVFQFDSKAAVIGTVSLPGPTDTTPHRIAGSFTVAAGARKFRIEAYQGTASVTHHLDDVWLTPR